jgi:3-oxoadipate enol-lactonase
MTTELHWLAEGDPAHATLLLLNPLGAPLTVWDELIDNLHGQYTVVRYDPWGHGRSPVGSDPSPSIATLATDALAVMDAADVSSAHFVGLSLGAMVAIEAATTAPERVASLCLLCTSAHFDDKAAWDERIRLARTSGLGELVDPSLERWFTPQWRAAHPDRVARARQQFLSTDPEGYAAAAAAVRNMDLRPRLSTVKARTMVVAGRQDPSTPPAMGRSVAAGIPDARYRELDGGHWLPIEAAQPTAHIVEEHLSTA